MGSRDSKTIAQPNEKQAISHDDPDINTSQEPSLITKGGIIRSDFWTALWTMGIEPATALQIQQAMKWSTDLYHLDKGDAVRVIMSSQDEIERNQLQAIWVKADSTPAKMVFWNSEQNQYFDQDAYPARKRFLAAPVKNFRISSPFNAEGREHPFTGETRPHFGTDYSASERDSVFAVADGKILVIDRGVNNGWWVKIEHDHEYTSQYLHLASQNAGIKEGQEVRQGDLIGFVGSTGLSTGPHVCLHFRKNGQPIDFNEITENNEHAGQAAPTTDLIAHRDSILALLNQIPLDTLAH